MLLQHLRFPGFFLVLHLILEPVHELLELQQIFPLAPFILGRRVYNIIILIGLRP